MIQDNFEKQRFEQRCMEEYKALRAESLRCAGIISNVVWIGITQFAFTLAAAINLSKDSSVRILFLMLLSLESIAATSMYLSELWKYARIGRYIREKIESQYKSTRDFKFEDSPICWENWIKHTAGRSKSFTLISVFILQIPIVICISTIINYICPSFNELFPEIDLLIPTSALNSRLLFFLSTIAVVDLGMVIRMFLKIKDECNLGFSKPHTNYSVEIVDD